MKLIGLIRSIKEYHTTPWDRTMNDIDFDISVDEIAKVVIPYDDDPLYYDGYVLTPEQLEYFIQLKSLNYKYTHDKYSYILECDGIYE